MFTSSLAGGPRTADSEWTTNNAPRMPEIWKGQSFLDLVQSLALYISETVDVPHTFEQLRTGQGAPLLVPLSDYLTTCHHPNIVAALLVLKSHYTKSDLDDRGVNTTRASACEIVAWRFLSHLPEREVLDYVLFELVPPETPDTAPQASSAHGNGADEDDDREEGHEWAAVSPATPRQRARFDGTVTPDSLSAYEGEDPTKSFVGFNALEIAVAAEAKRFLGQRRVQKIVNAIWCGDIIFWDSLNVQATRKAQKYIKWRCDPYVRLRVPLYMKVFECLFTISFLLIYYAVLFERNDEKVTFTEGLLFVWIAAFTYDEFGEINDTASLIYTRDFWNYWDVGVLLVGIAYMITRIVGLACNRTDIVETAFDILSLEALFLVPRLFSLLSLNTYFGTLIPCLKEITKNFVKFLVIVAVLFAGFLTTFTMLGRARFDPGDLSWQLLNVFFGATAVGFEVAERISPTLGPPLMVIFVACTNILLMSSLISLLSYSLISVMANAREEYHFQYSVYVLDAVASKRLTYFFPPLNLLPLVLLRPLRLGLAGPTVRSARIGLLKATHAPFLGAIWAYESLRARWRPADASNWYSRPASAAGEQPPLHPRSHSHSHSFRRTHLPGRSAAAVAAAKGGRPQLTALTNKSEISLVRTGARAETFEEIDELKSAVTRLTRAVGDLSNKLERLSQAEPSNSPSS